jgi:hypothetical protein
MFCTLKKRMDNTRALFIGKQALLAAAAARHAVIHGSCAVDRYISPCMRFGADGHQDLDVFLPLSADTEPAAEVLDVFLDSVSTLAGRLHTQPLCWTITMNCNGLYCAHVSVQQCHFADVMLVPRHAHDAFEASFPRNFCSVYLSSLSVVLLLRVLSLEEAVYRMQCVLTSSKLLDGLPCLPEESNKAMIIKTSRRLERLRMLDGFGMLRREPSPWYFDVEHEFQVLTGIVKEGLSGSSPFAVQFHAPSSPSPTATPYCNSMESETASFPSPSPPSPSSPSPTRTPSSTPTPSPLPSPSPSLSCNSIETQTQTETPPSLSSSCTIHTQTVLPSRSTMQTQTASPPRRAMHTQTLPPSRKAAETQTAITWLPSAADTTAEAHAAHVAVSIQRMLSSMDGFQQCVDVSLQAMDRKLTRLNVLGRQLAKRFDGEVRSIKSTARQCILAAATMVKDLRLGSYLTATRPIRAMQDIIRNLDAEVLSVFDETNTPVDGDGCSLGEYKDKYTQLTTIMARNNRYPFNLIPDSSVTLTFLGPVSSEALVLSGLKMNLMASFVVFLRCLRMSSKVGPDTPLLSPVTPFSEWSDRVLWVTELSKSVEKLSAEELKVPANTLLPVVDSITGDVGFMVVPNPPTPQLFTDKFTELTNEHLVPQLDPYNVEFLMHMFDNVIGNITIPIVAHVAQLKQYMALVRSRTMLVQSMCATYVDTFAATPCVAEVQKLQHVVSSLVGVADALAVDGDKVLYSWNSAPSGKKKGKKKSKKKS